MLKLNLPSYDYLLKKQNDRVYIFDLVRKKYVFLSPEEWVRQHFLNFLISELSVPVTMIGIETSLKYNKLSKRSDILVFSNTGSHLLLVECKAPAVKLDRNTVFQLSVYNKKLNVPYIAITNGMEHFCWKWNSKNEKYEISEFPVSYNDLMEL